MEGKGVSTAAAGEGDGARGCPRPEPPACGTVPRPAPLLHLLGSRNSEQTPLHTRVHACTRAPAHASHPGPPHPGPVLLLPPPHSCQNPWKTPAPCQGTGDIYPRCTLTQAPPKKNAPAPRISPSTGMSRWGSPVEGSHCFSSHGTLVAWARDRLWTPWDMFPAVIKASPVRSVPDGDFSTFVALLPHLPPLPAPAVQACPAVGLRPRSTQKLQDPLRVPRSQTPPHPGPYLGEEEDEDDTGAAGLAQHPLGPCPPQSPLPWGGFRCPSGCGAAVPGRMSSLSLLQAPSLAPAPSPPSLHPSLPVPASELLQAQPR